MPVVKVFVKVEADEPDARSAVDTEDNHYTMPVEPEGTLTESAAGATRTFATLIPAKQGRQPPPRARRQTDHMLVPKLPDHLVQQMAAKRCRTGKKEQTGAEEDVPGASTAPVPTEASGCQSSTSRARSSSK